MLVSIAYWKCVEQLDTCHFSSEGFGEVLHKIQKSIEDLQLRKFFGIAEWVVVLNQQVPSCMAFCSYCL